MLGPSQPLFYLSIYQANARVLMSPASKVEQLAALWAQVKARAAGEGAEEAEEEAAEEAPVVRRLQLATAKRLMRRYYLVQQAREAAVVGLLVGSLSASYRQPLLKALKALCKACRRKC